MNRPSSFVSVLLLLLFVISQGCVSLQVSPVSGNKRVYGYSWEQELKLGREADPEIVRQYGLYEDEELSEYVTRLGQELLEISHFNRESTPQQYRNTEFTFRVLDSPVVNAFALPGGFVYVTRGLMTHLQNEAQLMVVLGHEIGHVAARHASQRAAEQQFGQLAVIGGAVLGESLGMNGGDILQLSSQTAQLMFLSYSRDDERESDRIGVEYAAMEGYEASEGAEFFTSLKRISERAGQSIPTFQSSHPDPGEREKNIPEMAQEWREKGYEMTKVNEQEYLMRIDGMPFGENPRNGFTREGTYFHPDLRFRFPVPGVFNLVNQPSAVILFNDAQDAIVQFTIDSENNSPRASVESFSSQEGINVIEAGERVINGYPAYQAEMVAQTEDGTSLTILMTSIEFENRIYQYLAYAVSGSFETYRADFGRTIDGFREVADPAILNIEPVRLYVRAAERTAPFLDLLPDPIPMDITAEELAIVNQVSVDQVIEQGTLLKIPVQ